MIKSIVCIHSTELTAIRPDDIRIKNFRIERVAIAPMLIYLIEFVYTYRYTNQNQIFHLFSIFYINNCCYDVLPCEKWDRMTDGEFTRYESQADIRVDFVYVFALKKKMKSTRESAAIRWQSWLVYAVHTKLLQTVFCTIRIQIYSYCKLACAMSGKCSYSEIKFALTILSTCVSSARSLARARLHKILIVQINCCLFICDTHTCLILNEFCC